MKFTLSWLKDHLQTEASLDAVVEAMTMAGLEVEDVVDPGAKLGAFSVARIVEAVQHPNADKLRVCQVDTRDGRKEIVCGAPNARAGLVTIYAPIGAYVPGSGVTLEARPVRGVVSNGMLCSGAELEVAAESDGILELDGALEVGLSAAAALGLSDPVIDFEVTPNRPDWLGVAGIARDLAAKGLGRFVARPILSVAGRFDSPVRIAIDDEGACPVFAARLVRGVRNVPSPDWLRARLESIGLRPRSALVDITNYLAFDRARPLHVYDAAKIKGVLRSRLGRAGESFAALDGKTYGVTPDMCVMADDSGVLGLGGVIGGESTGVSEETRDVLIECAYFDPLRTFQTGRATGIVSDARYRFERGVDPAFVLPGIELATRMVLELCGGSPSEVMVEGRAPAGPAAAPFDMDRVRTLTGLDVRPQRIRQILKDLGFEMRAEDGGGRRVSVKPPSWRADVRGPADIVEEVARIEGFDKLPGREPPRAEGYRPAPLGAGETRLRIARRVLASAGYLEAVTWSFCARAHAEAFGGGKPSLLLANPIAADLDCMRPSALPNLLTAAQRNLDRGHGDVMLFEAGPAYLGDGELDQIRTVAAIRQPRPRRHWNNAPAPDLFDMKRDCLAVLEAMGAPMTALQAAQATAVWRHPGRSGAFKLGQKIVAVFGEVHPRVLDRLGVEGPALAFEIFADDLPTPKAKPTRARAPLERHDLMPLSRDFAFVVEDRIAAADVVRAAYGADKTLIADIGIFDVYRGAGVPEGSKSLAIEVTLQPREKTLDEGEIEAVSKKIIAAVMKATGGTLRG